MAVVKQHKVVASLPDPLEADSIYYVRAGDGVDVYVTNGAGMVVAYPVNVGGGGLTLFAESVSTTSPNNTAPAHVLTPIATEYSANFVIAPKGDGAILAQVPDGTATGGDKRGWKAVDLQMTRSSSGQVAKGASSVVTGGMGNTAYSIGSVVSGGYYNQAVGDYSFVGGGAFNQAIGDYSSSHGRYAYDRGVFGSIAESAGSALGRQQVRRTQLWHDTASTTPLQITANGTGTPSSSNSIVLPNNSVFLCRVSVVARTTFLNKVKSWECTALVKRGANAASTVLIGSTVNVGFEETDMELCSVSLSADTSLGGLAVVVTPGISQTIRWVAQVETVEAA